MPLPWEWFVILFGSTPNEGKYIKKEGFKNEVRSANFRKKGNNGKTSF